MNDLMLAMEEIQNTNASVGMGMGVIMASNHEVEQALIDRVQVFGEMLQYGGT